MRHARPRNLGILLPVLGVVAAAPQAAAQPAPDPQAILRSLIEYCDGLETCLVEYRVASDVPEVVGLADAEIHVRLAYQAPRTFRAEFTSEHAHSVVGVKDDVFYGCSSAGNRYVNISLADEEDWWFAVENDVEDVALGDPLLLLALLASAERRAEMLGLPGGMETAVREDRVGESPCHVVRVGSEASDVFELWVEADESPVLRSIRITANAEDYGAEDEDDGRIVLLEILCKPWEESADLPELAAEFVPPANAVEVPGFSVSAGDVAALLGQPAPDFSLPTTDGPAVSLAELADGKVVVLEFISTGCGFCAEAAPQVAAVAKAFEGKPVAFQTIDLGDAKEDVLRFAEACGLETGAALDSDRAVGELYVVSTTPTLVLIGLDGAVQVYHQGAPDDLEAALSDQITRLLAGEELWRESGLLVGGG